MCFLAENLTFSMVFPGSWVRVRDAVGVSLSPFEPDALGRKWVIWLSLLPLASSFQKILRSSEFTFYSAHLKLWPTGRQNPNEIWVFQKSKITGMSFLSLLSPQVNLRATDVRLMRQLLVINESIESIKWMIEEKATITSRGSSLSGSLCSLLESQSTSLRGSYNSLHDGSDGLDGISVGSFLDTLADDVPGHQTPSDLDQFSDSSIIEDSQALHKHPKLDSEYYCFG